MAKNKQRRGNGKDVKYQFTPAGQKKGQVSPMIVHGLDLPSGFQLHVENFPTKGAFHKHATGKFNKRLAGQPLGPRGSKSYKQGPQTVNLLFNLDISVEPAEYRIPTQSFLEFTNNKLDTRVIVEIPVGYLDAITEEKKAPAENQELFFWDDDTDEWLGLKDLENRGEVQPLSKTDVQILGWDKATVSPDGYYFAKKGIAFYVVDWPVDDRQGCSCC